MEKNGKNLSILYDNIYILANMTMIIPLSSLTNNKIE